MFMLKGKEGAPAEGGNEPGDDSTWGRVKRGFSTLWSPKHKATKQKVQLAKNLCMFVGAAAAMHFYGHELII